MHNRQDARVPAQNAGTLVHVCTQQMQTFYIFYSACYLALHCTTSTNRLIPWIHGQRSAPQSEALPERLEARHDRRNIETKFFAK